MLFPSEYCEKIGTYEEKDVYPGATKEFNKMISDILDKNFDDFERESSSYWDFVDGYYILRSKEVYNGIDWSGYPPMYREYLKVEEAEAKKRGVMLSGLMDNNDDIQDWWTNPSKDQIIEGLMPIVITEK